jgi:aryl-alcohol dehydrogenase-like predicted oxidoreductase
VIYNRNMSAPTEFKLNTGATIPAIGLGTWQAKPGEVRDAVSHALKDGYTHLDCALCYQVSSLNMIDFSCLLTEKKPISHGCRRWETR